MTHFEVNGQKYIGVEAPEGYSVFDVKKPFAETYLCGGSKNQTAGPGKFEWDKLITIPAGNYEIIGLAKDLTNDDMRNILGVSPSALFLADWVELKFRNHLTDNTLILKIKENE